MTQIPHRMFQQPWPEGEYRFFQLGFAVDDIVDAASRWASVFGIGPFHVYPRMQGDWVYRGTETVLEIQIAIAQAGPVQIELIEQFSDQPSVYRDVFAKGESGFHQICTVTADYDEKKKHYEHLGYELRSEVTVPGWRLAFYDTYDDFGFFTELVEETPEFLANTADLARTCADWDGTDPVRIITRGGYRTP